MSAALRKDDARSPMLGKIHIAKKALGLDDDTYRDVLERVTGQRSAKDLSEAQLAKVLEHFYANGFRATKHGFKKLDGAYAGKLQALWIAGWNLGVVKVNDDAALLAFVKRQTGLDHMRFLHDAADAAKAIEALKGWLAREAGVDWKEKMSDADWMRSVEFKIALAQINVLFTCDPMFQPAALKLAEIKENLTAFGALNRFAFNLGMDVTKPLKQAQWHVLMNTLGARIRKLAKLDSRLRGNEEGGVA